MAGFVAGAYELRDKTAGFMKNLGGDLLLGTFQAFEGAISKVIEASIIIMMASGGDGGLLDVGGEMIGDWLKKKGAAKAATGATKAVGGAAAKAGGIGAGAVAGIVAGAGLLASALGEGAFQLRKVADKPIKETQKKYDKASWLDPRKYFHGAVLAGQKMLFAPIAALGLLLDIVGAPFRYAIELTRYPFLGEKDKKKQARNLAKMDSRIREDFRKGLNMLTLGFAFKEKGQFGNIYGNKGAQKEMMSKMASGGTAGRRKVSRKLKRPRVQKHIMPTTIRPGSSIGDKKDFDKMFPDTKNYQKHVNKPGEKAWWDPAGVFTGNQKEDEKVSTGGGGKPMDPIGYIEEAYKTTSEAPFFGPLMGATIKLVAGDEPSKIDYMNVGKGLNAWVYSTFGDAVKEYAEGGEVSNMFLDGKDLSAAIAKSVEHNTKKRANDVITELRSQLAMAPLGSGSGSSGSGSGAGADETQRDSPTGAPMGSFTVGGSYEKKLAKLLASYEGLRLAAYPDAAHGWSIPTIGIGATFYPKGFRLSGKVKKGDTITEEEAYWIKQHHIKSHRDRLFKEITPGEYAKLPDGVKAALESKVFNYGSLGSPLTGLVKEAVKSGNYSQVSAYFRNTLAAHNGGINSWRRNDEAGLIGGGKSARAKINFGSVPTPLSELSVEKEPMKLSPSASEDENMKDAMGSGSPLDGKKIAGELGHYMKSKKGTLPVTGSIHRHPEHPSWSKSGHSTNSYHYSGRALDIGGWSPSSPKGGGADEQAPVLKALLAWNKQKGVKPVELIHGSPAYKNVGSYRKHPDSHHHHVHVAYQEGGETLGGSHLATLGERGKEFVIDADSTAAMQDTFPGLLSALNKADYDDTIKVLRNYAHYELGATQNVDVPDEMITPIVIPLPSPPVPILMGGGGSNSDPFQILDNGH